MGAKRQPLLRSLQQRLDHAGIRQPSDIGDRLAGGARSDRQGKERSKAEAR